MFSGAAGENIGFQSDKIMFPIGKSNTNTFCFQKIVCGAIPEPISQKKLLWASVMIDTSKNPCNPTFDSLN